MTHNFDKYDTVTSDTLNTPYDYHSIMHYGNDLFTSNTSPTLVPLEANVKIGQRYFMSSIDIGAVRKFYNCSGIGTTLPTPTITAICKRFHQQTLLVTISQNMILA